MNVVIRNDGIQFRGVRDRHRVSPRRYLHGDLARWVVFGPIGELGLVVGQTHTAVDVGEEVPVVGELSGASRNGVGVFRPSEEVEVILRFAWVIEAATRRTRMANDISLSFGTGSLRC